MAQHPWVCRITTVFRSCSSLFTAARGTRRTKLQHHQSSHFDNSCVSESLEQRLLLFALESRWTITATDGPGLRQGDATTLTWSIVDDGTPIPALSGLGSESTGGSTLVSFLNGIYGTVTDDDDLTDERWFGEFQSVVDRWSELSGLTFQYVSYDDGKAFNAYDVWSGELGIRADIRIGGHRIDGNSGVLAYAFAANNGEMVIDAGDNFFADLSGDSLKLRNLVSHELGHSLGLGHVTSGNAAFLMEPVYSGAFDGPQFDDILGIQRHYGDRYEKGSGNDSPASATFLGALGDGQNLSIGTGGRTTSVASSMSDIISIDDESDIDVFSFTTSSAGSVNVTLTPVGPTYRVASPGSTESEFNAAAQSDLNLQILDSDGVTVLFSSDAAGLGEIESVSSLWLDSAGTYFVKVSGSTLNRIQTYGLSVDSAAMSSLSLDLSSSVISENAGSQAAIGTIRRSGDLTSPLIVSLSSSDTTEVTVPATVTILAGQQSASFPISAVNDSVADGVQSVTIRAVAGGHGDASISLSVTDDDTATLQLSVQPASFSEGAGTNAATGTVTRNTEDLTTALVVGLLSNDLSEVTVPASVIIPAGQTSVSFPISAVEDTIVDGTQTVSVLAAAVGFANGQSVLQVTDNDVLPLTADILDVTPDPRSTPAGQVVIEFSTAVSGFDITDLKLRRNGALISLSSLQLIPLNPTQFMIDLTSVTNVDGAYTLTLDADTSGIQDQHGNFLTADATEDFVVDQTPPSLEYIRYDDGTNQRSVIRSIEIAFDSLVTVDSGSIRVTAAQGLEVPVILNVSAETGRTVVFVSFSGELTDASGSLADGNYSVTITPSGVRDQAGNPLLAVSTTQSSGNDVYTEQFFRLFGDADGDRDVDAQDFARFVGSYRTTSVSPKFRRAFDLDGDGDVDAKDFAEFLKRYRTLLNPFG